MVSIILVHYNVQRELIACIQSIILSAPKAKCEIIVVDNQKNKKLKNILVRNYKQVIYLPSQYNLGYGSAVNMGAKIAKGKNLFILNPDTIIYSGVIDNLNTFLISDNNLGAVAPLLINKQKDIYQQGTEILTPFYALFVLSFINKIFPNNLISAKYFYHPYYTHTPLMVGVVPGTAFMIKKSLFRNVGGFDGKFFLYFEEFDLCKRLVEKGYKNYILQNTKVMHLLGASTKKENITDIRQYYLNSRKYYFNKHYGSFLACLVNVFVEIGKKQFAIISLGSVIASIVYILYRCTK